MKISPEGIYENMPSSNPCMPISLLRNCYSCKLIKVLETLKFFWKQACLIGTSLETGDRMAKCVGNDVRESAQSL